MVPSFDNGEGVQWLAGIANSNKDYDFFFFSAADTLFLLCREITAAPWFARMATSRSSWAWASMAEAAPDRTSLASSLTCLSTRSGYTKSSERTPTLSRCTDSVEAGAKTNLQLPIVKKQTKKKHQQSTQEPLDSYREKNPTDKWDLESACVPKDVLMGKHCDHFMVGPHPQAAMRVWNILVNTALVSLYLKSSYSYGKADNTLFGFGNPVS